MDAILCINCRRPYPDEGTPYRCPSCGGLYDFAAWPVFDPTQVERSQPGIWRYRHALGLPSGAPPITLGEGGTPLVWAQVGDKPVAFKLEGANPSGSFKDRGSAPIVSFLRSRGVTAAVEDSSGNAGASFAAYAARAGMQARIFVPDSASGPKRWQIEAYGAELVRIMGPRSNAAEAVRKAADAGAVYASHAYLPFNLPGYATAAYELVEQLGEAPGAVFVPVGQGGLFLGMGRAFASMLQSRLIQRMPVMVAVQARACAPLWALQAYGPAGLGWVAEAPTVAEGIRVRHPLRGDAVLRQIEQHNGRITAVDEAEIIAGRDHLARQGLYVEMTCAVVWAAIEQLAGDLPQPWTAVLTGSGLKTAPAA
jgi:threonine synthase